MKNTNRWGWPWVWQIRRSLCRQRWQLGKRVAWQQRSLQGQIELLDRACPYWLESRVSEAARDHLLEYQQRKLDPSSWVVSFRSTSSWSLKPKTETIPVLGRRGGNCLFCVPQYSESTTVQKNVKWICSLHACMRSTCSRVQYSTVQYGTVLYEYRTRYLVLYSTVCSR